MITGRVVQSNTEQAITATAQALGASEQTASAIGSGVDMALSIGLSAGTAGFSRGAGTAVSGTAGTQAANQFSGRTIDNAVGLVMRDANKVNHIFAPKHNLGGLVNQLGGQENTIRATLNAASGQLPASGVFNTSVSVGGQNVFIRGSVIDGIPRIGTMYIP